MPEIQLEYQPLRISHIDLYQKTKQRYVKDPAYCTEEELRKNIVDIPEPIVASIVMPDGREIPIIFENLEKQVVWNKETVGPE